MTRFSRFSVPALIALASLAGCSDVETLFDSAPPEPAAPPSPELAALPGAEAPPPPATAVTAEAFDTTSAADREAATAAPEPAGETRLGPTVAALGNPADPGFWLETPLVSTERAGRVVAKASGAAVQVTLRPIPGEAGAGSRISLAALRLLDVGLAGLHELEVYAR